MNDLTPLSIRWLPVVVFASGVLNLLFYAILRSLWSTVPAVGLAFTLTFLLEDYFSGRGQLRVVRALVYGGAGAVGMTLAALILS